MSPAYITTNQLVIKERFTVMSSRQMANRKGGKTEPCLTPNFTENVYDSAHAVLPLKNNFKPVFEYVCKDYMR